MTNIVIFTIRGVILGGQISPIVASRISQKTFDRGLGVLFLIVGGVLIAAQVLG